MARDDAPSTGRYRSSRYRPTRPELVRYILGGKILARRSWVRHDLTDAGWRWRVCRRAFYQLLPVVVVAALLPLPGITLHVLLALLVVVAWSLTVPLLAEPLRNRKLRQHDLPVPEAPPPPPMTYGPPPTGPRR